MPFRSRAPTLTTFRPSPTTILYRVSNAAPRTSLPSKLLPYLFGLARFLLFAASTLYLYASLRVALAPAPTPPPPHAWLDDLLRQHTPVFALAQLHGATWVGVPAALLVAWACSRRDHLDESLLLIRGLGIQTSSASAYYWATPTTRFIPTQQIQDIVLHEAFKGFEVRFYLAVVIEGEGEAVVVFPQLLPNKAILEEVWRGAKACLYEPPKTS